MSVAASTTYMKWRKRQCVCENNNVILYVLIYVIVMIILYKGVMA